MYRGFRSAAAHGRHAAKRITVSNSVAVLSFVLIGVSVGLAAIVVRRGGDDVLTNIVTLLGLFNAGVVFAVGRWGRRESRAREELGADLIKAAEGLPSAEVNVLLMLHRFVNDKHKDYELTEFKEDGELHNSLRLLRTDRLIVSMTKDSHGKWNERGRFRKGDRVRVLPLATTLCKVQRPKLRTAQGTNWSSIRKEADGRDIELVISDLDAGAIRP